MPRRRLLAAALLLFLLTVLVRLPAGWVLGGTTHGFECRQATGSIWRGRCAQLTVAGTTLAGVSWTLHPAGLLALHIDADLRSADARAPGSARLSLGMGGQVSVQALRAEIQLDSGLLPQVPRGWSGRVLLDINRLSYAEGRITVLQGTLSAASIQQRSPPLALGSYALQFADPPREDGTLVGSVRDAGGPLAVSGTLELRGGNQYELDGTVATRPEAAADFGRSLEYLGPADAQGRRPFSLAGTF